MLDDALTYITVSWPSLGMLWERLDVGSVNQTAPVMLLQQIAEELPVEVRV